MWGGVGPSGALVCSCSVRRWHVWVTSPTRSPHKITRHRVFVSGLQATESQLLGFQHLFRQYTAEKGTNIDWSLIKPPPEKMIAMHGSLADPTTEELGAAMQKLAVLKLNGGLGTGMGCKGSVHPQRVPCASLAPYSVTWTLCHIKCRGCIQVTILDLI